MFFRSDSSAEKSLNASSSNDIKIIEKRGTASNLKQNIKLSDKSMNIYGKCQPH